MSRYKTRRNASTPNRTDELKKLEKRKSRVKERISDLTTTKRGTPRVRVDEEALRRARARKREVDAEIRAAREREERAREQREKREREKEKKRRALQKKRKAPHRREAAREEPAKLPKKKKKRPRKTPPIGKGELAAFERQVREEERARAKEERREERAREKAQEKRRETSRKRRQAIELGDYQSLAEVDDISDSEAFTIILYETAEAAA